MQNLTVSSQLAAQKNNTKAPASAANADQGDSASAADATPQSAADVFGKMLAQQVALAKPGRAEEIVAALKDKANDADSAAEDTSASAQIFFLDPNALPVQKFAASNASAMADSKSAFAEGVPSAMSAIAGKELPVGDGKAVDVAAKANLPTAPNLPEQADPDALKQSFESMLGEKQTLTQQDIPQQANMTVAAGQAAHVSAPNANAVTEQKIEVPQRVGSQDWGSGLGDKVVWMVGNQTRGAEIHLNPPALGPLEVRVSITDGQANLSFMTQHASVREAIEAATPRLREMLGDTGISMGNVSVDVGSFAQQQSQQQQQQAASSNDSSNANAWFSLSGESDGSVETFTTFVQPSRGRGVVDYFA